MMRCRPMGLYHHESATRSAFISRNKNSALRYKVQFGAEVGGTCPLPGPRALMRRSLFRNQLARRFRRWLSVACLLLVLVFAGLEPVHIHSDRSLSSHSGASLNRLLALIPVVRKICSANSIARGCESGVAMSGSIPCPHPPSGFL